MRTEVKVNRIEKLIRDLRDKTGMTQTEIAEATGISQPRISRWEGGDIPKTIGDAFNLIQLAKDSGVDVSGL